MSVAVIVLLVVVIIGLVVYVARLPTTTEPAQTDKADAENKKDPLSDQVGIPAVKGGDKVRFKMGSQYVALCASCGSVSNRLGLQSTAFAFVVTFQDGAVLQLKTDLGARSEDHLKYVGADGTVTASPVGWAVESTAGGAVRVAIGAGASKKYWHVESTTAGEPVTLTADVDQASAMRAEVQQGDSWKGNPTWPETAPSGLAVPPGILSKECQIRIEVRSLSDWVPIYFNSATNRLVASTIPPEKSARTFVATIQPNQAGGVGLRLNKSADSSVTSTWENYYLATGWPTFPTATGKIPFYWSLISKDDGTWRITDQKQYRQWLVGSDSLISCRRQGSAFRLSICGLKDVCADSFEELKTAPTPIDTKLVPDIPCRFNIDALSDTIHSQGKSLVAIAGGAENLKKAFQNNPLNFFGSSPCGFENPSCRVSEAGYLGLHSDVASAAMPHTYEINDFAHAFATVTEKTVILQSTTALEHIKKHSIDEGRIFCA